MKKIIASIMMLMLLTVYGMHVNASSVFVDIGNVEDGVLGIAYRCEADTRYKVMISKETEQYSYDYFGSGQEYFPLQNGSGDYKVSFMENISGTKYRVLYTEIIKANIKTDAAVFLQSVQNVNWSREMKAVSLAEQLVEGLTNERDKVEAIYLYIITNIEYDYGKLNTIESPYVPDIEDTLISQKGICYDYSALFASMLRSQGIPTKLIMGYTDKVDGYHSWNEVLIDGEWVPIDTTYDAKMEVCDLETGLETNKAEYQIARVY